MRSVLLTSMLFLVSCVNATVEPKLSTDSYGAIRFGASLKEVEGDAGGLSTNNRAPNLECDFVVFKSLPKARFMVEKGIITRADVQADVPNTLGIAVGTRLDAIQAMTPIPQINPSKYDPSGHTIRFVGSGARSAIVMEESAGVVTKIRGGIIPSVDYVEGCL